MNTRPDKYFICFGFENFCEADLKPFHVTMIYFGELPDYLLEAVRSCLINFFEQDPWFSAEFHTLTFWNVEMFGPNNDVRVLTPTDNVHLAVFKSKWNDLRVKLEQITNYKGYPFNPHLTTELSSFKGRINQLYLCKNNYEVIDGWDLDD
jgi:hypothetical protein